MDKKPYLITVFNQKGGVGKTTISNSIYLSFVRSGYTVSFNEMDKQGGSIVPHRILQDADVEIADTPAGISRETLELVQRSDLIVIPTLESTNEVTALKTSVDITRRLGKPFLVVVNESKKTNFAESFRSDLKTSAQLDLSGVPVLLIPDSVDVLNARKDGKDVIDTKPFGKQGKAMLALCNQVRQMAGFEPEPPKKFFPYFLSKGSQSEPKEKSTADSTVEPTANSNKEVTDNE